MAGRDFCNDVKWIMSYLDNFINRLTAQRNCLDLAVELVRGIEGPVLEFGLGHGRTYDHLRQNFPDRDIYAFENRVSPNVFVRPADELLFLGDIADTIRTAAARLPRKAALAHSDLGLKDRQGAVPIVADIIAYLPGLMAKGGFYISNVDIALVDGSVPPAFRRRDFPQATGDQYHIYEIV